MQQEREKIDPDRLKIARGLRGMTQGTLSIESGIPQGTISKLENGLINTIEMEHEAEHLERVLEVAPGFLRRSSARSSLPEIFYRTHKMLRRDQNRLEAEVVLARAGINSLIEGVDFETAFDLPNFPIDEHGDASEVARRVRKSLMIPEGPVLDLTGVIEATGTLIVPIFGAPDKFDAMASPRTQDCDNNIIFVDMTCPGDRFRFNVAHELGHLVLHRQAHSRVEPQANEFAAELLMPAEEIRPYLKNLTLERAVELKRYWRVSIAAIVYRANFLGAISEGRFKSLQVQISRKGWRQNEPCKIPLEKPYLLEELVKTHLDFFNYSQEEIGKLFGVSWAEFRRRHFGESVPSLRLIQY